MLNIPVPTEELVHEVPLAANPKAQLAATSWYNYWMEVGAQVRALDTQADANTAALAARPRNVLINGDFIITQRYGSAWTGVPVGGPGYVADRWRVQPQGIAINCLAGYTSPTGFLRGISNHAFLVPAAGCTYCFFSQRIEAATVRQLLGSPAVTFSAFIAVATPPGAFTPQFFINTPTAVDNWTTSSTVANGDLQTVSAAAGGNSRVSWSGDIRGFSNITNGAEVYIGFPAAAVVNGAHFWISECQLEPAAYVGQPPSPFELTDVGLEFIKCKRYYQKWYDPPLRGVAAAGTGVSRLGMPLPVEMRTKPTVSTSGTLKVFDGAAVASLTSIIANYATPASLELDVDTAGGLTLGRAAVMFQSAGGVIDLNAEL